MRRLLFTIPLLALVVAGPALADQTFKNKELHVKFTIPDSWHTLDDGDDTTALTVADKKEDVALSFIAVDDGVIDDAAAAAGKRLKKSIKDLTWGKPKKITINGMKGVKQSGDGTIKGKNIDVALVALGTPSPDGDLLVIGVAEDAKLAAHQDELDDIFESLAPY
jgi:hypothetical protein